MTDARNAASGVEALGVASGVQARNAASGVEALGSVPAGARDAAFGVEVLGVPGVPIVYVTDMATGARIKAWSGAALYDLSVLP
jgi:hypothetical protein